MSKDAQHPMRTYETKITIATEPETAARNFVEHVIAVEDIEVALGQRIRLVVEELVTNVRMHGRAPEDGVIQIALDGLPGTEGWTLTFTDPGCPFNPLTDLSGADPQANVEEERIGGMGWPLILEMSEILSCRRCDGLRNQLVLRFKQAAETVTH